MNRIVFIAFFAFASASTSAAGAQRFPPPIWDDDDRQTVPEPKTRDVADWYDFLLGTFGEPTLRLFDAPRQFRKLAGKPKEAENVNAFDEVPNSSWFTNRYFFSPWSPAAFARGPPPPAAPAPTAPRGVIA
ncbi:MAG: hypothetical protein HY646_22210, partial [Acidobacteria bacterium]|nr:hypothetical protein [Acidobacteriota bacterium]